MYLFFLLPFISSSTQPSTSDISPLPLFFTPNPNPTPTPAPTSRCPPPLPPTCAERSPLASLCYPDHAPFPEVPRLHAGFAAFRSPKTTGACNFFHRFASCGLQVGVGVGVESADEPGTSAHSSLLEEGGVEVGVVPVRRWFTRGSSFPSLTLQLLVDYAGQSSGAKLVDSTRGISNPGDILQADESR